MKPDDIFESLCKLYDRGTLTEIEREKLQQHFDLINVNLSPKESLNVKEIEEENKLQGWPTKRDPFLFYSKTMKTSV